MGRKPLQLEAFQEEIQVLIIEKVPLRDIARILQELHNQPCSLNTLKRRVKSWNLQQRKRRPDALAVEAFIDARFHYSFDSDKDIVRKLQRDGFDVTEYHVRALRWKNGWLRRAPDETTLTFQRAECLTRVKEALKIGSVRQYGQGMLTSYFRGHGIHLQRDDISLALRVADKKGTISRSKTYKAKKRREYRVPGPNWLWAIDGHAKLIHAGIEIYGAIDTYSRCIVWVFVGLSACTQVSVVRQFLQVVRSRNLFPKRLRSDRGSETAMIADAQYYLSKEDKRISEGLTEEEAAVLPLRDCYIFGTSTSNVRIESWWNQLQQKCLIAWRQVFWKMIDLGHHEQDSVADCVILHFIFIPLIRDEVNAFITAWNGHKIRRQADRPNLMKGIPENLYWDPAEGVTDYGKTPNIPSLDRYDRIAAEYDFNAYLAPGCEEWCNQQLRLLDLPTPPCANDFLHDRRIGFPLYYTALRDAARLHYTNGNIEPKLAMLAHPKAGYAWAPAAAVLADMDANFETVGLVEGGNAFAGGVA